MPTIAECLAKIRNAIYGEEVRGSIIDAITQCYTDVENGVTEAVQATQNANAAAQTAIDASQAANAATQTAITASLRLDEFTKYNTYDLISGAGSSSRHNGIDYTKNSDGTWTVDGTSTAASVCSFVLMSNGFPDGMEAGGTYYIQYTTSDTKVAVRVIPYINGTVGSTLITTTTDAEFTIPADASGICIRFFVSSGKTISNATCQVHVLPTPTLKKIYESPVSSAHNIAFFGDSIMWGRDGNGTSTTRVSDTIPKIVAKRLRATCDNFGVGGMGYLRGDDANNLIAYDKISSTDITGYDTIVISFGANDGFKPVGDWNSTDETTCLGQFNKIINYIYTQNPVAKVIVFAPFNGTNAGTYPDYWYGSPGGNATSRSILSSALQQACKYYWIPYVEQTDSPINAKNITVALPDGVHPSADYYPRIGDWFAEKIRNSGSATQAAGSSNAVESNTDFISDIELHNSVNLFGNVFKEYLTGHESYYSYGSNGTRTRSQSGITFEWDSKFKVCTVNGTASSNTVANIFYSETSLPGNIAVGQRLIIEHQCTESSSHCHVRLTFYKDNSDSVITYYVITSSRKTIYVPSNATGMSIRLRVDAGTVVDNVVFSDFCIRTSKSNYELDSGYNRPLLTIIDDDGNKHFLADVVPLIEELNAPISTAIPVTWVGGTVNAMTWEQIEECNDRGAEVLNHTYNHHTGTAAEPLSEELIQHEYQRGTNILLRKGFHSCDILVYSSNTGNMEKCQRAAEGVVKCGIKIGGSEINTQDSNKYALSRFRIDYASSEGGTDWNLTDMKSWVDDCALNGGWMIWMFHTSNPIYLRRVVCDGNGDPTFNQDGTPVLMSDGNGDPVYDRNEVGNMHPHVGDVYYLPMLKEAILYARSKGVEVVTAEYAFNKYFNG